MVAFAAVVLAFTGCSDGTVPSNYYLNVTPNTNQSVSASTTAVNFAVSANVVWEVYVDGSLEHTGTAGDNLSYQLTMPANESLTDAVVYNVVFKSADLAYNRTIPVTVTQKAVVDPTQPHLEVSPDTDQNVDATTTSFQFAVEANVSWIYKVNGTQKGSFTNDQTVNVTFPANASTTNTVDYTVVFESTDAALDKTVTVVITQGTATPTGPAVGDILYKETWGAEEEKLLAEYTKTGTTTYVAADKSGITYSSANSLEVLYAKVYDGGVALSSGYANASGGSHILIPKSSRGETITISNIKTYGAAAIDFSMAHRRNNATDVTVTYEFSNGTTGTFVSDASEAGNDNWIDYSFATVTVPSGATSMKIMMTANVDSNIRADDFIIKAAAN